MVNRGDEHHASNGPAQARRRTRRCVHRHELHCHGPTVRGEVVHPHRTAEPHTGQRREVAPQLGGQVRVGPLVTHLVVKQLVGEERRIGRDAVGTGLLLPEWLGMVWPPRNRARRGTAPVRSDPAGVVRLDVLCRQGPTTWRSGLWRRPLLVEHTAIAGGRHLAHLFDDELADAHSLAENNRERAEVKDF